MRHKVRPTEANSIFSLIGAFVAGIVGIVLAVQGQPLGMIFILFAVGTGIYHIVNLQGGDVPVAQEIVVNEGESPFTKAAAANREQRLAELKSLLDKGLIDADDFERKQDEILADL